MKRLFLLVIASCAAMTSVPAQTETGTPLPNQGRNIISTSPLRLWNGVLIRYERVLNDRFTVGGTGTYYYDGLFPGFQISPAARFYFKKKAPEGFYLQVRFVAAHHSYIYELAVYSNDDPNGTYLRTIDKKQRFTSLGGGIAGGYQLLWGKTDRWSADFNLGVKLLKTPPLPKEDNRFLPGTTSGGVFSGLYWVLVGPGSILDGSVSIGYRF